jgi:hypothetical protein
MKRYLMAAGFVLAAANANAGETVSEVWINPGFATVHFDSDKGLTGKNYGLGAEYRWSKDMSATVGRFRNSDREMSNYAGLYYQPWQVGPFKVGAVVAAFDGYPKMRNGSWFPALIPVATVEGERVGLNIGFIPSYKDRLYGGISFQLKLKIN